MFNTSIQGYRTGNSVYQRLLQKSSIFLLFLNRCNRASQQFFFKKTVSKSDRFYIGRDGEKTFQKMSKIL